MPNNRDNILLLLNAAEGLLQIGLAASGQIKAWRELPAARQGAEVLIPTLAGMLAEGGYNRTQISRIACVRGPGSFTGIRLALTTAFGLSRAITRPVGQGPLLAGLDYLPLLASSVLTEASGLPANLAALWVLTHARRGQVNIQGFSADSAALNEPETVSLSEAVAKITSQTAATAPISPAATVALVGSGLTRNKEELTQSLPTALLLPEAHNNPSPHAMLRLAENAIYSRDPIEPLYLRPCDAEENLPGIAAGLGLDPEEAALALKRLQTRIDAC